MYVIKPVLFVLFGANRGVVTDPNTITNKKTNNELSCFDLTCVLGCRAD